MVQERDFHIPHGGQPPIPSMTKLHIALWFFGNKSSYREIAEQFGVSESCVFFCVKFVITFLNRVSSTYIRWPTHEEAWQVEQEFKSVAGFPGVIGAIDGSHIEIKAPNDTQADYQDRRQRHSVNVMAVCDAGKKKSYM